MGEIGGQTDNNKRCLRQLHKGGMLRLELIVEYFSFFSSSFDGVFKKFVKDKKNLDRSVLFLEWIIRRLHQKYIFFRCDCEFILSRYVCLAWFIQLLIVLLGIHWNYLFVSSVVPLFPYIMGLFSCNIWEYFLIK